VVEYAYVPGWGFCKLLKEIEAGLMESLGSEEVEELLML